MPISVPVVRAGAIVTPQFVPPGSIGVAVASNAYVFDTTDDFFLPDLAPHLGANVLASPRVVSRRFAGMHYHTELPTVPYAVARNIDVPGCMWLTVEPARGVYEWSALDAFVGNAVGGGRDTVFNFLGTPAWASARPTEPGHYGGGSDAEPANPDDLAAFADAVCQRYRARGTPITAFEIWNEPKYAGNGGVPQGNYFTGTPAALAAMARAVFRAVKAADAAALVLSPAPTGLEFAWVAGDRSGTDHLHSFMAASDGAGGTGRDWVDAIAFHSYSHTGENNLFAIPQMVANVRAVMALHGLSDRAIWITETSAITPPLNTFVAQRQQEYIARTLLLALGCGVERVLWYAWDDPLGFSRRPDVASYWSEFTATLGGATLSLVNSLRSRRVAAVVDGRRVLI
jgi:Glycosyl hydrolase catalytic core